MLSSPSVGGMPRGQEKIKGAPLPARLAERNGRCELRRWHGRWPDPHPRRASCSNFWKMASSRPLGKPGPLSSTHTSTSLSRSAAPMLTWVPVKTLEHSTNVLVALAMVARRRELDGGAGAEKLPDLLDRAKLGFVHVDHHRQDDRPVSSFASIFFQAHTTVDKARSRPVAVTRGILRLATKLAGGSVEDRGAVGFAAERQTDLLPGF